MSFHIPSLNALGSFVFELCCGQTDRHTHKQTEVNVLPTPSDSKTRRCQSTFNRLADLGSFNRTISSCVFIMGAYDKFEPRVGSGSCGFLLE